MRWPAILNDCFTNTPDYDGYQVRREDVRIFDPAAAAGAAGSAAECEDGRSGGGGAVGAGGGRRS